MNYHRRNVLKIIAATSSVFWMPVACQNPPDVKLFQWEGYALGADTSIQLYGSDKDKFDEVIKGATSLIARLENIFSLYDPESEVVSLNKNGRLENPSAEMRDLIRISKSINRETNGAFDISVQPLWVLYDSRAKKDDKDEFAHKVERVLTLIGSEKINVTDDSISFAKQGMGVSFNGIAQGYITDKVSDYIKVQGFSHVLVDVGEYCAVGPQHNGEPWRIGLLDPFDQISVADIVALSSGGLATSGGYGLVFDPNGENHHLFDPSTGKSSKLYASVTVVAQNATTADAFSTAFSNMEVDLIKTILEKCEKMEVRLTDFSGKIRVLKSTT